MNPPETDNSIHWDNFTALFNTQAPQVLEWIASTEACLQAVEDNKLPPQIIHEVKSCIRRSEAVNRTIEALLAAFEPVANLSKAEHQEQCDRVWGQLKKLESRIISLSVRLDNLTNASIAMSPKESTLFLRQHIETIPTGAPFISSLEAQLRPDLWNSQEDGTAVFKKTAKGNPQNFIEHYISSPGDVTMLPWDAAEKIINHFGFNTVKLQLILAAHAMNQEEPWSGSFTLSGEDVIKEMGWNYRKDIPLSQKLSELSGCALALDCLLVKVEWKEGQINQRKTKVTIQTSRMWNISISVTAQKTLLTDKIDNLERVELQVQPGLWTKGFLNRGGAKAKEALYQFGYLAQSVLKMDPYHNELAIRLAIHLTLERRFRLSGEYRVRTLLEAIPVGYQFKLEQAQQDRYKSRALFEQWNEALKTLMRLGWTIEFDENYPEALKPDSQERKPKGYINLLLESKLAIHPPEPIPELLDRKQIGKPHNGRSPKPPLLTTSTITMTGEQVKEARKSRGWSQAKLAGTLGVSQQLISHIEAGRRELTPEVAASLKKALRL